MYFMTFIDRLKRLLDSDFDSTKTNNMSGPSGPLPIDDARDKEISWSKGFPSLLSTPKTKPSAKIDKETSRPNTSDRGGSNTGTLPNNPLAPSDRLFYTVKDRKVTEENLPMSYVQRLAVVLAKPAEAPLFKDILKDIKTLFPELIMKFPKPPTYVWNPRDVNKTLDPQSIKDTIKVKIPSLTWVLRMSDGVEEAELGFVDESTALFEIGAKANHLTITYYESRSGTTLTYAKD